MASGCDWYSESPDLRCAWARNLQPSSGTSAKDACCACGGGNQADPHPNKGSYYFQSQTTGQYLGTDKSNDFMPNALNNQNWRSVIEFEPYGKEENVYALRFSNGKYLSIYPDKDSLELYSQITGPTELFEWTSIFGINGGGTALKNVEYGVYITVTDTVGTAGSFSSEGALFTTFNAASNQDNEELVDA